jgi:hypothetical protein
VRAVRITGADITRTYGKKLSESRKSNIANPSSFISWSGERDDKLIENVLPVIQVYLFRIK